MATQKANQSQPKREQTQLTIGKDIFRQALKDRIQIGEEIYNRQIPTKEHFKNANMNNDDWEDYNSELLKQSFNNERNEYKNEYDSVNFYYGMYGKGAPDPLQAFREKLKNKLTNLNQLLIKVDLMKSQVPDKTIGIKTELTTEENLTNKVFIVHGHNNEIRVSVAHTLEKLGLNPIILHEQPNSGKTIIEKFEIHSNVGFAIVILTDDDLGKAKTDENLNQRARQNVILELGYFIGKLGRDKVCPLYTKGVELPSDLYGLLYTEIDKSEHWKIKMAKELKAAGYEIDVNKII